MHRRTKKGGPGERAKEAEEGVVSSLLEPGGAEVDSGGESQALIWLRGLCQINCEVENSTELAEIRAKEDLCEAKHPKQAWVKI